MSGASFIKTEVNFMKLSIILLAIIFLAIVGVLASVNNDRSSKINYRNIVVEITLVLLGFSLALTWDTFKEAKKEKKERESIVFMLQSEMGSIHGAVNSNLETIQANLAAMEKGKETVRPLLLLDTDAWESAKLRNNVFIKNTGDLFKMVNLYSAIHIINEKIRFRENYRVANQALINYIERLKIIDNDIKNAFEKVKGLHVNAQKFLHEEYPMVVTGYSFSLDKGVVKESGQKGIK